VAPFSVQCNLRFLSTKVLQGSVGTCVNYGRIFIDFFTANLLQSVMVKEFENWLEFRGVTGQKSGTFVFRTLCIYYIKLYKATDHVEYCSQIWSPHYDKDIKLIEGVQRRATKLVTGMQDLQYDERLR